MERRKVIPLVLVCLAVATHTKAYGWSSGSAPEGAGAPAASDGVRNDDNPTARIPMLDPAPASGGELLLAPIRRIGIRRVKNNARDFRRFMDTSHAELRGFAAEPLGEAEAADALGDAVARVVQDGGRFWSLETTARDDAARGNETQARLERSYDLDAWLVPEVYFEPDHTMARLSLHRSRAQSGRGGDEGAERILAREDVLTTPQASRAELSRAFAQALTRLVTTLGHDGRVTFSRESLVTLDFGTERGLTRGARLDAGVVVLSALHPQTREYLRTRRIRTHELEVIESRPGSSIARITGIDRVALAEVEEKLRTRSPENEGFALAGPQNGGRQSGSETAGRLVLLAWRPGPWTGAGDRSLVTAQGAPEGFSDLTRPSSDERGGPVVGPTLPSVRGRSKQKETREGRAGENRTEGGTDDSSDGLPPGGRSGPPGASRWDQPESWKVERLPLGIGSTYGLLKTVRGRRNTGLPPVLLNTVSFGADVMPVSSLRLAPELRYANFTNGDVTGSEFELSTELLWDVAQRAGLQEGTAGAGVYVAYDNGTVTTLLASEILTTFEAGFVGEWGVLAPGVGEFLIKPKLSVTSLLSSGDLSASLMVEYRSPSLLPKELAFSVELRQSSQNWMEVRAGAQWNLLP